MVKIAVCDDDQKECHRTQEVLMKYIQEQTAYEVSVHSFSASLELLSYVEEHGGFDVFLLDIYMPGMLGTDTARLLRKSGHKGEIIFLTTSRDHAIEAFEVDAAQYLIKPYSEMDLHAALGKVLGRISEERRHMMKLKTAQGIMRIFSRNVLYTETSRNNYQIIHMADGQRLEVRMTTGELFERLSQNKVFVKCGASICLNLKYVRQIRKNAVVLDSGEELVFPYRSYGMLREKFLALQMTENE